MWIKFTNPTFYYIDPSQEYVQEVINPDDHVWNPAEHDGSSVEKADRALPAILQNNTVYLIRRTDPEDVDKWCNLTQVVASEENANHIAIMGMPKEDDPLYAYMPADAKDAWSSDEYDRGVIAEGANFYTDHDFIHVNAKGVYFMNIEYKQRYRNWENVDLSYDAKRDPYSWALYVNTESVVVSGCKFVLIGSDLEKDQHNDFSTAEAWWKAVHRVRLGYSISCLFENNVFVISPCSNRDRGAHQIYFSTKDGTAIVRNNIIHNTGIYQDGMSPVFNFNENSSSKRDKVEIYNITEYLYKCTTNESSRKRLRPLIGGWFFDGNMHDITVQFSPNETTAQYWPAINYTHISAIIRSNMFKASDITVNLPECNGSANMFSFKKPNIEGDNQKRHAPRGQWIIIKDLIATFCDYGESGFDGEGSTVLSVGDDRLDMDRPYFTNRDSTCNQIILQNVNIKASMAGSDRLALDLYYVLVNMADNDVEGCVRFYNCIGKIGKVKTYYVGNAFRDSGYNLMYCDGITCNKNNPDTTYNGQQALSPSWYSNILVKSTNTVFIADTTVNTSTANSTNCLYVCPSDQSEGQFTVRNPVSKAQAWSVNRTGGHQCSLRLTCHEGSSEGTQDPHLVIGGGPFKGIKVNLTKGLNKCTIYFTGYGYNNFYDLPKYTRIEAKRPDGTVVGGDCGLWEEDTTSKWNNIDNNLSMKYTMFIDMEEDGEVEFTYRFWWNVQMDAYTFIDPFPIVEQIAE